MFLCRRKRSRAPKRWRPTSRAERQVLFCMGYDRLSIKFSFVTRPWRLSPCCICWCSRRSWKGKAKPDNMTSAPPGTAERIRNLDLSLLIVGFEGLTRASSLAFDNFDADEELALENAWYIYAFCDL